MSAMPECWLIGWPLLVAVQNGVDYAQPRPRLEPLDRLLSLVAGLHRVLQHLPYCLSRKATPPATAR